MADIQNDYGRREQDMSVIRETEEGQGMPISRSEQRQPESVIAAAHPNCCGGMCLMRCPPSMYPTFGTNQ